MYKTYLNLSFITLILSLAGCNAYPTYYPPQQNPNTTPIDPNGTPNPNAGVPPVIINTPPAPPAPPAPTFGPGQGNNMQGFFAGTLTIHTNSANGKLTLRANPSQNAQGLVEIPNGVSGISYFNKMQVGEYVWYNATYGSYTGWLRGDYVDVY